MHEIRLVKKSIHLFMNEMVVKKRETSRTADFIPLVNHQVTSKIRNIVGIIHMLEK